MEAVLYILTLALKFIFDIMSVAFLLRAIMSFVSPDSDGAFVGFLYFITEPIIIPYRRIFEKKKWFEGSMFDVPFFFGMISVTFLSLIVEFISNG